jgi:hypothetical protein
VKIGLVGGSYQQRSLPFDAQRSVNLFALADRKGSDVSSLLGTPGLNIFSTCGAGPIRGGQDTANGRAFFVSGNSIYEITSAGASILRGTLLTSSGAVSFADNGLQLGVCDGAYGYIFTYATNAFVQITDLDFPSPAGGIDFIDGYFIVNQKNTGKFFISAINNGLSWAALDFATAESSPDNLVRAVNFVGQLGLLGENTLEIWRNTGDSLFPFSRISGSTPVGTIAPNTVISIDTSTYWVGHNSQGGGIVYRAQGFTPVRISTDAIELILQAEPDQSLLRSWTYQQEGHVFLVITGGSLKTSLVYDLSTQLWHERAFLNSAGNYEQHLGNCCIFVFGKHLVGSRKDGSIYQMSLDFYSDNGSPIQRRRVYTHLIDEFNPVRYNELQVGFETGVGLSATSSNPQVSLRISMDGARTWSSYFTTSLGAIGKYNTQVKWRRLGINQQCTFEITYSDPTKVAITGSYLT